MPKRLPVDPERHQVPGPQRHVRIEQDLLGDVADGPVPPARGAPSDEDLPGGRAFEAEDHPQQGGLAGAVGADQPGELPGPHAEADVVEDLRRRQRHADALDRQESHRRVAGCRSITGAGSRCRAATAFRMALTSASIHDW